MKRNLFTFIGLSAALTTALILANYLLMWLPAALASLLGLVWIVLFFYVVFDLIVKIIYRFAGVTKSIKEKPSGRLTYEQSELVGRYWITWLLTSLLVGAVYVLIFETEQWKSNIFIGGLFAVLVLLSYLSRRKQIKGYAKKDLFQ